jgi:hypothetical protein
MKIMSNPLADQKEIILRKQIPEAGSLGKTLNVAGKESGLLRDKRMNLVTSNPEHQLI